MEPEKDKNLDRFCFFMAIEILQGTMDTVGKGENGMLVVGSKVSSKRVFHRTDCMYAKRIKEENRIGMSPKQVEKRNFCICKYCGGLKGEMRIRKKDICEWEKKYQMQFCYIAQTDTLYIRTDVGFWKIFMKDDIKKYLLYHKNKFDDKMPTEFALRGHFHRQKDVKETYSLQKLVEYIAAHDRAKQIVSVDYRMLPQHSKQQKKYYKAAKQKAKRQEERRLDALFTELEKNHQELKKMSFC